jgi:MoaA/NifB/PqqE/SkfB family radical SAM enzyme
MGNSLRVRGKSVYNLAKSRKIEYCHTMSFPGRISFTLTNLCNLHCRMCGQWSREGYMHSRKEKLNQEMKLDEWKRLVDEIVTHNITRVLLRGGEPFLFPGIIELLEYINNKGMHISIDTNGTLISRYASDIARIGNIHLTVSVDGPQDIHDGVRGVRGGFIRIKEGIARLNSYIKGGEQHISTSISFTISRYSYRGLGAMPDVARDLGIKTISIIPYYYFPDAIGREYERELREHLGCPAFSWKGFHHEGSGIDLSIFRDQLRTYLKHLDGIYNYPYMSLSEDEYRIWFSDSKTPVGSPVCNNVERLIDIQPCGRANFCVDFIDYSFGNCREQTIEEAWNSERAELFRTYRRKKPLAVCYRCGAKYMSEQRF